MGSSLTYRRPSLIPLLLAAVAALSLAGFAAAGERAGASGESPVQQARELADEVWEEGDQTGKEEALAHRPEREQAKLEEEEERYEAASQLQAAPDPAEEEG